MANRIPPTPLPAFSRDPVTGESLHRQLYETVRRAILTGTLAPGARLPSTRACAADLGISRSTAVQAFDQLLAEGYIEGRMGAGTFVYHDLPDAALLTAAVDRRPAAGSATSNWRALSEHGRLLEGIGAASYPASRLDLPPRPFRPMTPALDAFPAAVWARIAGRRLRTLSVELLGIGCAAGYLPLRIAIAAYLTAARGAHCDPDQVLIVGGAMQALDLAGRVLLDPGDKVWIEDPGYMGAAAALQGAGARLIPVPVDGEGLDVAAGVARAAHARLAYVTPSAQFPLGVTMSLGRRLALLEWAERANGWIVEDDYDSEYRFSGRPLAAMQGLDQVDRVIYVGTFSKVLFPGLRLGYLVLPADLVAPFVIARDLSGRLSPLLEQAIRADFITGGHFMRHIRRLSRPCGAGATLPSPCSHKRRACISSAGCRPAATTATPPAGRRRRAWRRYRSPSAALRPPRRPDCCSATLPSRRRRSRPGSASCARS
ncbi:MAG: MocR-like pyridoxine biosynthesis transcription factor PdxR [Dehalococcoidia bacterium]